MYFPSIPVKIALSGNIPEAQRLISLGRKVLFELKRDNSWTDWNTNPSGQRVHLLSNGTKIQVNFRYGLSTIMIHVPLRAHKARPKEECACCSDCLLIGRITSLVRVVGYTRISDADLCQKDQALIFLENVSLTDGNINLKSGDRVIIYATPVLLEVDTLTYSTGLRNVQNFKPGKVWQFYNCMLSDNAGDSDNDLRPVGLDNQVFTVTGDSCLVVGSPIPIDENEIPVAIPLRFYITSLLADECLTL